jgi:hypothetical protein
MYFTTIADVYDRQLFQESSSIEKPEPMTMSKSSIHQTRHPLQVQASVENVMSCFSPPQLEAVVCPVLTAKANLGIESV